MATIVTDNDFREAARWWLSNSAVFTGPLFIDATQRAILDEGAGNANITPDSTTLEAALDNALIDISDDATNETAQAVTRADVMGYLWRQLASPTPNIATIYAQISGYVDGNAKLQTAVQNVMDLYEVADGQPVDLLTASGKAKYLRAVLHVVALIG